MEVKKKLLDVVRDKIRLKAQVEYVEGIHAKDVTDGYGTVHLPYALERKYPNARYETKWQGSESIGYVKL